MSFKVGDFFAQIGIKADTKEVKKIESSLNKVKQALSKIDAQAKKTGKSQDKVFKEEDLRKKRLALERQHEVLKRMGGSVDRFKNRLVSIKRDSSFKKLANDIAAAKIEQEKLNHATKQSERLSKASKSKSEATPRQTRESFSKSFVGARRPKGLFNAEQYLGSEDFKVLTRKLKDNEIAKLRVQAKEFQNVGMSTKLATRRLRDFTLEQEKLARKTTDTNRKLKEQNIALRRLKSSTVQLAQTFVGAFAIFESIRSINRVGQDFEGMRAAMLASSGSAKMAAEDLKFVDNEVVRLGLDLKATTDAYAKLQFAAKGKLSKSETRELFTGFSEFATALKVDPEQQKAGLRAIQQMLNKGQIMSEELKSQ